MCREPADVPPHADYPIVFDGKGEGDVSDVVYAQEKCLIGLSDNLRVVEPPAYSKRRTLVRTNLPRAERRNFPIVQRRLGITT
jgi:hypothetical protein